MKTIGLIGGMSWESTVPYYRAINEAVRTRLGGLHSAKLVLYSVDFEEIELLQRTDRWDVAGQVLGDAGRALAAAGADFLLICANTMHKVAPAVEAAAGLPLLHVVDATAEAILAAGHRKVGLLGTRYTMEQEFYRERLTHPHGLEVIVPDAPDRALVHRVIFDELCRGQVREASRAEYRRIMAALVSRGAEAVILGCTELSLLVGAADASVPLFDTTVLHARRAVDWALA
jgi:aspartate racemase